MTMLPNGRSKGLHPSDFNQTQLRAGTRVELEHTTDRTLAQRIAMDHLAEDPAYYQKLRRVHLDGIAPERMWLWLIPLALASAAGYLWWRQRRQVAQTNEVWN